MANAPEPARSVLADLLTQFPALGLGKACSGEGYAFVNDIEILLGCEAGGVPPEHRVAVLRAVAAAHGSRVESVTNADKGATIWWTWFTVANRTIRMCASLCAVHDGPECLGDGHRTSEEVAWDALSGLAQQSTD